MSQLSVFSLSNLDLEESLTVDSILDVLENNFVDVFLLPVIVGGAKKITHTLNNRKHAKL